ncbi:MAG TPA: histidine phosphatase family protein [Hyphomicrobium sp.]|nr:histidine phosphatase family protein [Hyphomicrobium sp.]
MKRVFARRHLLTTIVMVAGFAAALGLSIDTDAVEGIQVGLLAVGFPKIKIGPERTCDLCTRTRQQANKYTPVPHYMGGPKRIILMRHADKTDDQSNEDLSDAGVERAKRLATYIPETFGKPDIIIASAPSKHSDRRMCWIKISSTISRRTSFPISSTRS